MPTVNYTLFAGDYINTSATFLQSDGVTPMNLAGYYAKMQIGFPTPVILSTSNGGITIPTPTNGTIFLNALTSATSLWPVGTYSYDLWLEYPGSPTNANEYYSGTITVLQPQTMIP